MNRGWTEKHIEELVKKYAKGGGSDIAYFESMFVFDDDTGEVVWWADNGIPDIIKQYYENDKTYRLDGCWWISSSGHNNDHFNTSRNVTINGKFYEDLTYEAYWHFNYFELPQTIYELLIRHTDHNLMAIYNTRYGDDENIGKDPTRVRSAEDEVYEKLYLKEILLQLSNLDYLCANIIAAIHMGFVKKEIVDALMKNLKIKHTKAYSIVKKAENAFRELM